MAQKEDGAQLVTRLQDLSSHYSMIAFNLAAEHGKESPVTAAAWQVTFKIDKLRELIEESQHEQHSDEDTTPRRWDGSTGRR